MILKGNQRANARELAAHLMNPKDNEHVTLHEIRGFISDDLFGALQEAQAISLGTQCTQFLFSLSLNPPEFVDIPVEDFEEAIEDIEKELELNGHPRIIVFHEKNGRRHCHCVWSRINKDSMTAINMSHYKLKLNNQSKQLYLKHGWELPSGFKNSVKASKTNYSRAEYQQAKRLKEDPKALKKLLQDCWEQSDNRASFGAALQEHGLYLAKGDKRGYVAVDYHEEVYSLSRWLKVKAKELKAQLGDPSSLPSVTDAKAFLSARMTDNIKQYLLEMKARAKEKRKPLVHALRQMTKKHRAQRKKLRAQQQKRWDKESSIRSQRLNHGMGGIFDIITGKYASVKAQNEQEIKTCLKRDRQELQDLVVKQFKPRRELEKSIRYFRTQENKEALELKRTIAGFINTATEPELEKTTLEAISEQIIADEAKIEALTGDITMLQASLENNLLSDAMRSKIRSMIERAKSALIRKYQQAANEQKTKTVQEHEEISHRMQQFFLLTEKQEKLRQQYQELQRQQAITKQLYDSVAQMAYNLNGVPLYKITMVQSPHVNFNEQAYVTKLRNEPPYSLLRSVKEPECAVTEIRQNTLQVKELLRRHNNKNAPSPKRRKRPLAQAHKKQ